MATPSKTSQNSATKWGQNIPILRAYGDSNHHTNYSLVNRFVGRASGHHEVTGGSQRGLALLKTNLDSCENGNCTTNFMLQILAEESLGEKRQAVRPGDHKTGHLGHLSRCTTPEGSQTPNTSPEVVEKSASSALSMPSAGWTSFICEQERGYLGSPEALDQPQLSHWFLYNPGQVVSISVPQWE